MHSTKIIDLLIQDAGKDDSDHADSGWSFWFRKGVDFSRHIDEVGQVTVEHVAGTEADSYGDMSGSVSVVVQVDAALDGVAFFRKAGYQDSYGDVVFDGELVEAKPVTKTVTVWE